MWTFLYFKWVIVSAALWTMEQLYEWQNSNNVMTYFLFGAIHKRRLLKGRVDQKCWNSLSKKTANGEGGGNKIVKMGPRRLWMVPLISDF